MLLPDDHQIHAFTRRWNEIKLLALGNLSSEHQYVELQQPRWNDGELLLGNCTWPEVIAGAPLIAAAGSPRRRHTRITGASDER